MPNTFVSLPAPVGNGVGAAVDISALGPVKTIVRGGNADAVVSVEMNNATVATDGSWAPVATLQQNGQQTVNVVGRWMRIRVAGYNPHVGGQPQVDIGAEAESVGFASLPAPASSGVGASVDTSALGLFKSVQVGGAFRGALIVEVSEDGADWGQPYSFSTPGVQTMVVAAKFMRVRRVGVPDVAPGAPIVNVAAAAPTGGVGGGAAISAGTQVATSGTVKFANSNGVSFGMSNSSVVTASVAPETPFAISAGTQSVSSGTVALLNANGLSFGMQGSTGITGSYSQSTAPAAIGANSVSVSAGTVLFSNSNNVTFGMTGSTITASASVAAPAIAAGTQTAGSGTVKFANSNGVSFGMSGNSQVTASISDFSYSLGMTDMLMTQSTFGQSWLHVRPITVPNVAFSYVGVPCVFSGAPNSTGTLSYTFSVGLYTQTASSLSLLHSTSFSGSINHSGTVNSAFNDGPRIATAPWVSTVTRGNYALAFASVTLSAGQQVSLSYYCGSQQNFSGVIGQASNLSIQRALGYGILSTATSVLPAVIAFSDLNGTGQAAQRPVLVQFGSSF